MDPITEALAALQAIQAAYPAIEALVPLIEKLIQGQPTTDADVVAATAARKALEAQAFPPAP